MGGGEANKRVVRNLIDTVWTAGDLDALSQFWTADCRNHAARGAPVGLAALRDYHAGFSDALAAVSARRIEVVQQVAEDDRVVTHVVLRGRHTGVFAGVPATGRDIALTSMRIDRLVGGRIAEHWSVADVDGLLAQLRC